VTNLFKNKMRDKIIFVILLIGVITVFIFVQKNNKKSQPLYTSAEVVKTEATPIPTIATSFMDSPDGTKSLTLEEQNGLQSLFVSSLPDGQRVEIYKKQILNLIKLEIPYNTWSPDNVYIFLKEKEPLIENYFVFQSSGTLFLNNLPFVSIQELFGKDVPNYVIEDVTGWAAPNLLIVNTKAKDSEQRVSFWFDVPSQSFIQLGTYFK